MEILTKKGFIQFAELAHRTDCHDCVAQVNPDTGEITYVTPTKFINKNYVGKVVDIKNRSGVDLSVTPNHDLLMYRKDGSHLKKKAKDAKFNHTWRMRGAGDNCGGRDTLTASERLQIAFQADGNAHSKTSAAFSFVKKRKIDRFLELMEEGNFSYNEVMDRDGRRRFIVTKVPNLKKLMREALDYTTFSSVGCRLIVEEAITWDGSDVSDSLGYYSSAVEDNTSYYQEVCIRAGMRARKTKQVDSRATNFSDMHRLFIRRSNMWVDTQNFDKTERDYAGNVHCVEVPTGCIIVRRSGKVVVVGNCHTFSTWADTFRPGYKFAGKFIQNIQPKVVSAFSATLPEESEREMREGLGIGNAKRIFHYPRRKNLHLATENFDDIQQACAWVAQACDGPTIVYSSTRKGVESYAAFLQMHVHGCREVLYYHGGMKDADRKHQQDAFMRSASAIIVATNAFGMGVDKANVRNVVHFDMPGNLLSLAQEVGRAGRDGEDSFCTIIFSKQAYSTQMFFIRVGNPTEKDIRKFVNAALAKQESPGGPITAKKTDICMAAGVDSFAAASIMAFCHGEGIFVNDTASAKKARMKFEPDQPSMTPTERSTRDAIYDVGYENEDGFIHFDCDALAEELNIMVPTLYTRMNSMQKKGLIVWVRATTGKPMKLGIHPDNIPPEAFSRLNEKAAEAQKELDLVLGYIETPDEDKHRYLEAHAK